VAEDTALLYVPAQFAVLFSLSHLDISAFKPALILNFSDLTLQQAWILYSVFVESYCIQQKCLQVCAVRMRL
jgi:hypothetical protein